jgi:WD40 repeat protein
MTRDIGSLLAKRRAQSRIRGYNYHNESEPRRKFVTGSFYNAFISYSIETDSRLADDLEKALQVFGKKWWKVRALRVFRDASYLDPSIPLPSAINNGQWFAASKPVASPPGTEVWVWQPGFPLPGAPILTLPNSLLGVAFNPENTNIALDSSDGDLVVLSLESRSVLYSGTGLAVGGGLAFGPDGVVASTIPGGVMFCDLKSHSRRIIDTGQKVGPEVIAISPDGRLVALDAIGNTIRLWDAITGEEYARLSDVTESNFISSRVCHFLAFSPDGRLLFSNGIEGNQVWGRFVPRTVEETERLTDLQFNLIAPLSLDPDQERELLKRLPQPPGWNDPPDSDAAAFWRVFAPADGFLRSPPGRVTPDEVHRVADPLRGWIENHQQHPLAPVGKAALLRIISE